MINARSEKYMNYMILIIIVAFLSLDDAWFILPQIKQGMVI